MIKVVCLLFAMILFLEASELSVALCNDGDDDCPFEKPQFDKNLYLGRHYDTKTGIPPILHEHLVNYTLWVDGGTVTWDFALVGVDGWNNDSEVAIPSVKTLLFEFQDDIEMLQILVAEQQDQIAKQQAQIEHLTMMLEKTMSASS